MNLLTKSHRTSRNGDLLGFTLLEVMVAVAILGLALTVILSAQTGLHGASARNHTTSLALGLARCKMAEVEEQMLKLGYPEIDSMDEGACCADERRADIQCVWKIERIEMPDPSLTGGDGGLAAASEALQKGTAPTNTSTAPLPEGVDPATVPPPDSTIDPNSVPAAAPTSAIAGTIPIDQLGSLTSNLKIPGGSDGLLGGALSAGLSGGVGALAPMAMGMVYPSIKPMLEASIRKVTVTAYWREGLHRREFEIVQWLTNPQKGGFLSDTIESNSGSVAGASGASGGPGASGASGSGIAGSSIKRQGF